jgi:hypothetical protein
MYGYLIYVGTSAGGAADPLQSARQQRDLENLQRQRQVLDFPDLLHFLQYQLVPELRFRGHSARQVADAIEPLTKVSLVTRAIDVSISDCSDEGFCVLCMVLIACTSQLVFRNYYATQHYPQGLLSAPPTLIPIHLA